MNVVTSDNQLLRDFLLEKIPQQAPFRFIDQISAAESEFIAGTYRFPKNAWFYDGMPEGQKFTPTSILIEAMAQVGTVAFGLYKIHEQYRDQDDVAIEDFLCLFTDVQVDFFKKIPAGSSIRTESKLKFWRRHKLRSTVQLFDEKGDLAGEGIFSGMAVKK